MTQNGKNNVVSHGLINRPVPNKPNFTLSTEITSSQVSQLFRLTFFSAYPLMKCAKVLRVDPKKLYAFLNTEHGIRFFKTSHVKDNFGKSAGLWVRANLDDNLIFSSAKLKPISKERRRAISRVTEVKEFGYYDTKIKRYRYTNNIFLYNQSDFANYQIRINERVLVFKPKNNIGDIFGRAMTMPYLTRFNDKVRQWNSRNKYQSIWEDAANRHNSGVLLTLTVDPSKITNLWDSNKKFMIAMHDFHNFIKKRVKAEIRRLPYFEEMYKDIIENKKPLTIEYLKENRSRRIRLLFEQANRIDPLLKRKDFGKSILQLKETAVSKSADKEKELKKLIRVGVEVARELKSVDKEYKFEYLNVLEFQKNGRLHSHLVIFGIPYLMNSRELSKIWDSYDMGRIVHCHQLKSENGKFTWAKKAPNEARNLQPVSYLEKYLIKAQYATSVNYWVYNTRFYTNSRNFDGSLEEALERKRKKNRPVYWSYVRSVPAVGEKFNRIAYLTEKEYLKMAGVIAFGANVAEANS